MFRVRLDTIAQQQIEEYIRHIANEGNPGNAQEWGRGLYLSLASLSEMPRRCSLARENDRIAGIEIRQLVYKSHRIIFSVYEKTVRVHQVRHAAMSDLQADDLE